MGTRGLPRLSAAQVRDWLAVEEMVVRRVALELRRVVLRAAPRAAEVMKFHCPCYFRPGALFGSIGGNICMIEAKRGRVALSFIQGAGLPDPGALLKGKAKAKRFVTIQSVEEARDPAVARLVRAAVRRAARNESGE